MTKNQINKWRMYGVVDLTLGNNSSLFEWYSELISAHQQLKDDLAWLDQYLQEQVVNTTGLTAHKKLLKAALILSILRFSAALRAYATSTHNNELKVSAYYAESNLKKTPDPILWDIGRLLFGLAIPIKTELQKYFVGENEIAEMENLLVQFKKAYPQKRVATAESKVSTSNISARIKSIDKLLKEVIDDLMAPFQFSQPDFYNTYINARIIVNYSGRGKGKPDQPDDPEEGEK